ncbi:cysteine--tRNA ligase [Eremococcus coleocola]|uniref:Cysteine--tRNA ligase n=1 Tax=Eremococcus coleocola ACS-139-V-Col8 TaxID=908337 RepID=E4KNP1_9LACT|nr:cysteine--tRNA ligase [Eremococcus coleocola]EFR31457.1 cysteine--tRNA ligase [Eremococcus coleocola ACS-139-V-Col8]
MTIQIYNTLTRQKEDFVPQVPNQVSMYVCGPTVYNYIHIGNARSAVAFDTVRRYLQYRGYQVNYVSNFTDVDDKIIKAAKAEDLSTEALSDKYIAAFKEDTAAINILPANIHPRVKDHITEIIDYIKVLIESDHAYASQGDVYFRTQSFDGYGKLSHQSISELEIGASQRTDTAETDRKEDPLDFALWKSAKEGEVSWPSPWGPGRPGWHIECSVMSTKYLGDTLDIHGGGQDLEFPHHENEIAQAEAHNHGENFANYWMHNGFVTFGEDGEKMSKSLGNFVLLRDLLKEADPMVVRYLLGTVHYRRPLRYDDQALQEAQTNIKRLEEVSRRLDLRLADATTQANLDTDEANLAVLAQLEADFIQAMDDDFNAANGMTVIFELVKEINRYLQSEVVSEKVLSKMQEIFKDLLAIFGLVFETKEDLLDQEIQALIDERNVARKAKDFGRADEIRDQLKEQGIYLDDTPQGTTWKRG